MPFLMSVLPSRTISTPSPCRMNSTSGNAAPPWETRYRRARQRHIQHRREAVAMPMNEPSGQPAGLALNCASVHAFCSVVKPDGSAVGSVRSTLWMFASPAFCATLTTRLAPFALLVLPCVRRREARVERQVRAVRRLERARDAGARAGGRRSIARSRPIPSSWSG